MRRGRVLPGGVGGAWFGLLGRFGDGMSGRMQEYLHNRQFTR
ncbi:hypothetical protein SMB34_12980 [Thalassospira permensis NBRC 106175]|uniref:Uncharacterized protein n=1 Tax=Thalassospira permensis NBRC 106175 TaxID=1353532 RepID=A0ABR4TS58_9PROT|nr:hypothetical protein SMB34_12980 [Thalassospira permensis NBRC 106175]